MHATPATPAPAFAQLLRRHRNDRKLSQLDLACEAGVSQRHVSYLETGRSRPSRDMVLTLGGALDISLRDQNSLLQAAGFAAQFATRPLDHPDMAAVDAALDRILDHHLPYPAAVIDRLWNLRRSNAAMDALVALAGDPATLWTRTCPDGPPNLARLTVHPDGIRANIDNADTAIPTFLHRLRREALSTGDAAELAFVDELFDLAGPALGDLVYAASAEALLPVLPLDLSAAGARLRLFTMITTFGTPQDVTTDELRIELFYPADADTGQLLSAQAASAVSSSI